MDEREHRMATNEAVFRALNERVEELNQAFATLTDRFEIVCECGDARCVDRISIGADEYEALRRDPARFALVHGHDDRTVEDVVTEHEGYAVVQKRPGGPAELAERVDPRSDDRDD